MTNNTLFIKPIIKNKIAEAFKKGKEGSIADFYKKLDTKFNEEKDKSVLILIKELLIEEKLFNVFEEFIKLNVENKKTKKDTEISCNDTINEYVNKEDWRINANANTGYSNAGLVNNIAGKIIANYWLDSVYSEEEGLAHRDGFYHIHDLDCLTGYCAGWSLRVLLNEGFNGVQGRVSAKAPRHFRTALGQMANFLGILQSEWAGAQAFSSFDTYLAPYVFKDNLSFREIKEAITSFVYNLNVPARWGQSPFTNITLDFTVPNDLKDQIPTTHDLHLFKNIDNAELLKKAKERGVNSLEDLTYKDFQKELEMIDVAYYEVMTKGDECGQPFTFPIPTVNITEEFDWASPASKALFENSAIVGSSYFQNFIGSQYMLNDKGEKVENPEAYKPNAVRSMCPLTSDTELFVKNIYGISIITIKDLVSRMNSRESEYQVFTPKGWANCSPVEIEKTDVLRIHLSNGTHTDMGINHLQPVMNGKTIKASELQIGMFLPACKVELDQNQRIGSYNLGYAVGAFLGDGSKDNNGINYSLSVFEKDDETENKLIQFWSSLGYRITSRKSANNVRSVRIGENAYDVISRFINGDNALNKNISKLCFNMSVEFKNGLIEGLRDTDGSREKRRIYTASKVMCNNLISLFASIGKKASISYEDSRTEGRYTNENTVYTIAFPERENYGEHFKSDNDFNYYSITNIEKINYNGNLYCIEVYEDSHLFLLANGIFTHNCRLQIDLRELLKRGNGLFGSAEMTGSIGVVTFNMARLGYLYKGNKEELMAKIYHLMDLAKSTLEKKRIFVQELYDRGFLPYTKRYLPHFKNHFSTIGVNGMNEMIRNFTDDADDITTESGINFATEILEKIRDRLKFYQETTGNLYNLEATPAEGTTYRFAKCDKKKYSDIIQAGSGENIYYTNSSQVPANLTDDPFEALDLQNTLQCKYTGGTVLHLYMSERLPNGEAAKNLVQKVLSNYRLPYITITPVFSVCEHHGYLNGEQHDCPHCHKKTQVWTRVMGYHRPFDSFNIGKKGEHQERILFKNPNCNC